MAKIRANDEDLQKWTAFKTRYLDDFAMQLVDEVRQYEPFLLTARNLYAQVALKPYAENWYSQSLEESLNRYDFTAIMAMPYMEQVKNPDQFYKDMVDRVKKYPNGIKKTVLSYRQQTGVITKRYLQLKWLRRFILSMNKVQCMLHTIQMTQLKIIRT